MRNIQAILIFMVLAQTISICIADTFNSRIKVGVSVPLTGEAASHGEDLKNVLLFTNERLLNNRYQLIFEDDRCDGRHASTVATKFATTDQVSYVLGLNCSGALLSAAPIYERNKIVVISAGASSPDVSTAGDYIFRTVPSDLNSLQTFVDYVAEKHSEVTIFSGETAYCEAIARGISELGKSRFTTKIESFPPDKTMDFQTPLLRLKSKNPRALILNTQTEGELAIIVKAIQGMKWSLPIYALYWPASPNFLKSAGAAAEEITFLDVPLVDDVATSGGRQLYKEFIENYGPLKSIPYLFVSAVNSFKALDVAILTGKDVKSALYASKFDGIAGEFSFDPNGDVTGLRLVMKEIKNGQPRLTE